MKKTRVMLAMTAAVLSACGGGGSDSGNASVSDGGGGGGGPLALTVSMQEAVNVFAESWIATQALMHSHYFPYLAANMAGKTSISFPNGGSATQVADTLTMNKFVMNFPADNNYSGVLLVTPNASGIYSVSGTSISIVDNSNGKQSMNSVALQMSASVTAVSQDTDSIKISNLNGTYPLSSTNTYMISNTTSEMKKTTLNNSNNFSGSNLNLSFAYTYKRNTGNSNVVTSTVENLMIPADTSSTKGITNNPTGGQYSIAQGGTGSCGTISVTFRSGNAINLICQKTGETQTFNWNDSTITAAKTKALQ